MKYFKTMLLSAVAFSLYVSTARAHTALMACYENGDGTVTCYGDFSDGSSAAGVSMRVVGESDNLLLEGRMDEDGEYTFEKPEVAFTVIFDAGPGHLVKEKSSGIEP